MNFEFLTIFYPQQANEVCEQSGIDMALDTIKDLHKKLGESIKDARNNTLLPLPGQTMPVCAQELGAVSKTVGSSMAQLLTAATQVSD